ncbi:MarR family transcriptional regulator [Halobacteriales archaeon QS_1_68_17]|nr:MAG: MarR family transcriptional regulator [Halobacteriales archaeon QS_1_68_17]
MDSAALLDLLGNENRRRILRLLAHKPCYVTEISEYLDVSPKAVIDHLRKLEDAGLIESRTDDQRRKYFYISRNVRLEVSVSPYQYGTKSAYPANPNFDMTSCRYLSIDVTTDGQEEDKLRELVAELERLEQLGNELSLAQRWVQGRLTDVRERLGDEVGDGDGRLHTDVMSALANGDTGIEEISARIEVPPRIVREALERLAEQGVVVRDGEEWRLAD